MMRRIILILTIGLVLNTPVQADIAAAYYALNHGDFQAAVKEFSRLADTGDAKAQSYLGYMYYVGQGVKQDYGQAVRWYRKAAQQGDRDAEYNLAVAYAFGKGVDKDMKTAADWYRKAAEQGHAAAQYSLGLSYAMGEGVKQDREQALRWFRKAADQGYPDAKKALQNMAQGTDRSSSSNAADKSHGEAQAETRTADGAPPGARSELLALNGIEPVLPGAKTPAKALIDRQSPGTGEKGTAAAGKQSADRAKPLEGSGKPITRAEVAQDVTPEFKSMDNATTGVPDPSAVPDPGAGAGMAAGSGENASHFLKHLFGSRHADAPQGGSGEPARAGHTAMNGGGMEKPGLLDNSGDTAGRKSAPARQTDKADPALYQKGMTALSNNHYRDAATAFHEAALQGDSRSQYQLGSLFYQGLGVTRDFNEALHWYRKAAGNGNADAQYSLGNMYLMGEGVKQNDQKAAYWYKKAADQGNESARHNLENLKRIISQARDKPPVAQSQVPMNGARTTQKTHGHKQGLFSRLFGRNMTHTDDGGAGLDVAGRKIFAENRSGLFSRHFG